MFFADVLPRQAALQRWAEDSRLCGVAAVDEREVFPLLFHPLVVVAAYMFQNHKFRSARSVHR